MHGIHSFLTMHANSLALRMKHQLWKKLRQALRSAERLYMIPKRLDLEPPDISLAEEISVWSSYRAQALSEARKKTWTSTRLSEHIPVHPPVGWEKSVCHTLPVKQMMCRRGVRLSDLFLLLASFQNSRKPCGVGLIRPLASSNTLL